MTAQTSQPDRALCGSAECVRATIAERLTRWLLVWALVVGQLYWPMSAEAQSRIPWPAGGQVRVYNPTGWQTTVREAADAWNRTGVTPTIAFTSRQSGADVVVEASSRKLAQRCDEDYRCDGFAERHGAWGRITLRDADRDFDRQALAASVRLAAHELGHILGLPHDTHNCALMNTDTGVQRCKRQTDIDTVRGPMGTDIRAAQLLYQRQLRPGYQSGCVLDVRETAVSARFWARCASSWQER